MKEPVRRTSETASKSSRDRLSGLLGDDIRPAGRGSARHPCPRSGSLAARTTAPNPPLISIDHLNVTELQVAASKGALVLLRFDRSNIHAPLDERSQ